MDKYWKKINAIAHYLKENPPSFLHLSPMETENMK